MKLYLYKFPNKNIETTKTKSNMSENSIFPQPRPLEETSNQEVQSHLPLYLQRRPPPLNIQTALQVYSESSEDEGDEEEEQTTTSRFNRINRLNNFCIRFCIFPINLGIFILSFLIFFLIIYIYDNNYSTNMKILYHLTKIEAKLDNNLIIKKY